MHVLLASGRRLAIKPRLESRIRDAEHDPKHG
jgi:hypothetical protein